MSPNNSQNAFIMLVAVLLVLVTLYFTTNALKRTYESNQLKLQEENQQRELEREHKQLIRQQLAAKELQHQADISAKFKEHQHFCYDLQIFTTEIENKEPLKEPITDSETFLKLMQSKKTLRKKDLNQTHQPKKGASTEPIIYLFVLVLLYLLLRAASDITQHYKEQSKGDKRNNRRCSLQVYAAMKNDRRSSKGIFLADIFKHFKRK